jgi:hypothetical protein
VFLVGIGLRDPRSQKRDLEDPSISPFDVADGTSFVAPLPTRLSEPAAVANDLILRRTPSSLVVRRAAAAAK